MSKIFTLIAFCLVCTSFQIAAQGTGWDTLQLHTPLTTLQAALQIDQRLLAAYPSGISYSDDQGSTWNQSANAPKSAYRIWSRDGLVYASRVQNGYDSTWVSNNEGANFEFWGAIRSDNPKAKVIRGDTMYAIISGAGLYEERVFRKLKGSNIDDVAVLFSCPGFAYNLQLTEVGNRLLLLSTDSLRWSDDRGLNWQKSTTLLLGSNFCADCGRLFVHENSLYFHSTSNVLMRSDDAGESWENLPFFQTQPGNISTMLNEGSNLLLSVRNSDAPYWRSTDLGSTWQKAYVQILGFNHIVESFPIPAGKRLFLDAGCFSVTINDSLLETHNDGLPETELFAPCRVGPHSWLESTSFHIFLTENEGHTYRIVWQHADNDFNLPLTKIGTTILTPVLTGFLRSDDGGLHWEFDPVGISSGVSTFCQENADNLLVGFSGGELYRYRLISRQWEYLSQIGPVNSLAFHQGVIFTEGDHGIRASTDFGNNFILFKEGLPSYFECQHIFSLGNRLFAGNIGGGLFLSEDLGMHWQALFQPDGQPLPSFDVLYGVNDALAGADPVKFLLSDDGGQQWKFSPVPNQSFGLVPIKYLQQFGDSIYVRFPGADRYYLARRKLAGLNFNRFSGRVFQDRNHNSLQDSLERGLENAVVYLKNSAVHTLTDSSGYFSLPVYLPEDSLLVQLPVNHLTISPAGYPVAGPKDSLDFAVFTETHDLAIFLESSVAPRPGFEQIFTLRIFNSSLDTANSIVKCWLDPRLKVLEASPGLVMLNDTLRWSLVNLPAFGARNLQIRCRLDSTAVIGTALPTVAWVQLTTDNDNFPENNTAFQQPLIVGSFDPNDKIALQGPRLLSTELAEGKRLDYLIRFQNTGNFPAAFVHIRDTLSNVFLPESFRLEGSSHPVRVRYAAPNVLDFLFPDIQLPDSTSDEPASHGFVRFSLIAQPGLTVGDSIRNQAAIFFDYNSPVMTPVSTILVTNAQDLGKGNFFHLHIEPNPAHVFSKVTVTLPADMHSQKPVRVLAFDEQGRLIKSYRLPILNGQLTVEGLPEGVIMLRVESDNQVGSGILISH